MNRPRAEVGVAALLVVLALLIRLTDLRLMEFKYDEAWLHERIVRHVSGYEFAVRGITSSFRFASPPLCVYLLSLPVMCSANPILCAAFIALLNALAVGAAYQIAREVAGRRAGVVTGLFFAAAPWAVIFSRKIWVQDLLAPFACVALGSLLRLEHRRRRGDASAAAAGLVLLPQLHMSALPLLALLPVAMWRHRRRGLWPWFAGAAIGCVPLVPYLADQSSRGFSDVRSLLAVPGRGGRNVGLRLRRFVGFRCVAAIAGADGFEYLLDRKVRRHGRVALAGDGAEFRAQAPRRGWITLVERVGILAGVLLCCVRRKYRIGCWPLVAWAVLPPLGGAALPRSPLIHYFVVTYPAQFVLIGMAFHEAALWLGRTARPSIGLAPVALAAAVAVINVRYVEAFDRSIACWAGTRADYGIAYDYKRKVAEHIAERYTGRRIYFENFSVPDSFVGPSVPEDLRYAYDYLLRCEGISPVSQKDADVVCALFNDRMSDSRVRIPRSLRPIERARFGPLVLWCFQRKRE